MSMWTVRRVSEQAGLYTWYSVDLPFFVDEFWPEAILRECPRCDGERSYRLPHAEIVNARQLARSGDGREVLESTLRGARYYCADCSQASYFVWLDVNTSKHQVRKVGQRPAPSVAIDRDLARVLGDADAELYRRALISIAQGYGLGACAYLRRILEHQLDPLLRLVREARADDNAPPEELNDLDAAIASKRGDVRTEALYRYAPRSIYVDGDNPLKLLYEDLSGGIHTESEDEATARASDERDALEYVFKRLSRDQEERRKYIEQVRAARKQRKGNP